MKKLSAEYQSWRAMKARCLCSSSINWKYYGERGIRISSRWLGKTGFVNFLVDMGPRPSANHTLDRISSDGDYEPGNCRWLTRKEQNRNRRDNHLLTFNGKTFSIAEWAEKTGFRERLIRKRIVELGWTVKAALTINPSAYRR